MPPRGRSTPRRGRYRWSGPLGLRSRCPRHSSSSVAAATLDALALACSAAVVTTTVLSRTTARASSNWLTPLATRSPPCSTPIQVASRSVSMALQVSRRIWRVCAFWRNFISRRSWIPYTSLAWSARNCAARRSEFRHDGHLDLMGSIPPGAIASKCCSNRRRGLRRVRRSTQPAAAATAIASTRAARACHGVYPRFHSPVRTPPPRPGSEVPTGRGLSRAPHRTAAALPPRDAPVGAWHRPPPRSPELDPKPSLTNSA